MDVSWTFEITHEVIMVKKKNRDKPERTRPPTQAHTAK